MHHIYDFYFYLNRKLGRRVNSYIRELELDWQHSCGDSLLTVTPGQVYLASILAS